MSAGLGSMEQCEGGLGCGQAYAGKRVHLVGIGGSGMQALAAVLLRCGAVVSGSDRVGSEATDRLGRAGACVHVGHAQNHVPKDVDVVVVSPAVPESNVELLEARRRGVRVLKYAQMLGELMRLGWGIAIAGTHGKSTTTAMVAYVLKRAGLDPSFVVGAVVDQLGGSGGVGDGRFFVVEACEYERSFLHLRPRCAAILNIEEDHLDYYRDIEQIVEAFGAFGSLLPEDGRLIVNADDAEAVRAGSASGAVVETFGVSEGADWGVRRVRLDGGCFAFEIWRDGEVVVQTRLGIAGRHNVMNAAAAAAVAWHCGVGPEVIGRGLADFGGVRRRLTLWGRVGGVTVVDDYAHHPTEIRATLEAARQRFEPRRVWVIFQPHQHSRTRFLLADFASSFELADVVVVPDIYFVRDSQQERARICAQDLVERLQAGGKDARYVADFGEIVDAVRAEACCGDLILTMGAGDIWKVASELVRRA